MIPLPPELPGLLLGWYRDHARVLPWRSQATPYRVWISEIMLQQTRVEAVRPYFLRFLEALPDVPALAACSEETLLKLWEGLGYYSRARNLQKAARMLMENHQGVLPPSFQELRALPGIGDYTAGAIASIAFGLPCPAVDGNVLRVLSRVTASTRDILSPQVKKEFAAALAAILPDCPGDFNQALMELGACVCLPNGEPRCEDCPLAGLCQARARGLTGQIPQKAPKKPRREEERTLLLLFRGDGSLALRRRPSPGLLAGMWEPVNLPGKLDAEGAAGAIRELGLAPGDLIPLGEAKHVFTHVLWQMTGWRAAVTGEALPQAGLVWAGEGELRESFPLPSAFRAFL